jgi:hypothetical protein
MNINSLGGPRMTPLTSVDNASSTSRSSFGSLLNAGSAKAAGGPGQLTGGNVISAAINVNQGSPGAGVGAPYQQAMPTPPAPGADNVAQLQGQAQAQAETQKMAMMKELATLSIASFASATFSLGNNKIQLEAAD